MLVSDGSGPGSISARSLTRQDSGCLPAHPYVGRQSPIRLRESRVWSDPNIKSTVERGPVDDDQFTEPVRARLRCLLFHPPAIDMIACNGRIMVSGAVLEHEAAQLLSGVGAIHGVSSVCDHLDRHDDASMFTV